MLIAASTPLSEADQETVSGSVDSKLSEPIWHRDVLPKNR